MNHDMAFPVPVVASRFLGVSNLKAHKIKVTTDFCEESLGCLCLVLLIIKYRNTSFDGRFQPWISLLASQGAPRFCWMLSSTRGSRHFQTTKWSGRQDHLQPHKENPPCGSCSKWKILENMEFVSGVKYSIGLKFAVLFVVHR